MHGPPVASLRAFLSGAWRFSRRIHDHRGGGGTTAVEGTASWLEDASDAGLLRFEERGSLAVAGAPPVETRAAYTWKLSGGGAASVFFADGRAFHDIDLSTGACVDVRHVCGGDTYVGSFSATADTPPGLVVTWRVRGPAKDYESVTSFSRPGP